MIFSKFLSDNHQKRHELQLRRAKLLKELSGITGSQAVVLTEELHAIDSQLEELEPLLSVFPCNNCEALTPVNQKVEINFKSGNVSRGEHPPIFLDGRIDAAIGKLGIRLCHSCGIEMGVISPEELESNLLPQDAQGRIIHTEGSPEIEAEDSPKSVKERS